MKTKLRDEIRDYYDEVQLSEEQLQALREKQVSVFHYASGVILTAVLFLFFFQPFTATSPNQLVLHEIAKNYKKALPLEIQTNNIVILRSELNRLPFPLRLPKLFQAEGWRLLGGRYCSIQGELAAQLSLQRSSEEPISTLYVVPVPVGVDFSRSTKEVIKGSTVEIWREGGILFGLASAS